MFDKLRKLKRPATNLEALPSAGSPSEASPSKARRLGFLGSAPVGYVIDALFLAVAAIALSAWLNIQYPIPTSQVSHLRVALEVPAVFLLLALARRLGLRLRWWFFAPVALLVLLARLFITADNVSHRFIFRDFRVPLDLRLVPEFFRLMYDTSPARAFASYAIIFVVAIGASLVLVYLTLRGVYTRSRRPSFRWMILGYVALSAGLVVAQEKMKGTVLYSRNVSSRIAREVEAATHLPDDRRNILKQIAGVNDRIGRGNGPFLDKLQGNDVLFIFVESYGRTVFANEAYSQVLIPRFEKMGANLATAGFHVASDFITSPTYGGFSWFAHATLDSGVKVISHLHSQLLDEQRPTGFADHFREAGYQPILVAPGTTRPWPGMDDYYGFRKHYFSWEFGYQGPRYGWPTMADQFVLYHIQKEVIEKAQQPLFIQYALVSSHAPFSDQPRYVENWDTIGNGSILHKSGRNRFNVTWGLSGDVVKAYTAAVTYEMQVMEGYLEKFVQDDTLVIFVGDHQPHQLVTGPNNLTWSVPIHVASRSPELIEPFRRRGYVSGMVPTQPLPHVGMERFMEEFLADFSTKPLAVDPGIWPPIAKRLEQQAAKLR
jgi:phosphoglycerol transferase MdoB-like AlkP superfamily enzyme